MSFREKKHKREYRFWFGRVAFVLPVEFCVVCIQKRFCARNTDLSIISIWVALISR